MNNREKTLVIMVGGVAAVGAVYWGYGRYQGYNQKLAAQISSKERDIRDTEKARRESEQRMLRWKQYGSQTLATDPDRLRNLLRGEAEQLAKDCSLTESSVVIGRLSELGRRMRGQKEYVRVLSATVRGEGQVEDIMRFLFRLHAQPYLVRVKSLSLNRPARNAPKGVLTMVATLETPILPATKFPITITPARLEPHERKEVPRTLWASFDDYKKGIVRRKLFQPYEKIVAKATGPNPPPNSQQHDITEVLLRWQPYAGASQQKVFFGAGAPATQELATLSGSQNQYKPDHKLENGKSYFWRIDTEFDEEWTQGDTWQFRVEPRPIVVDNTNKGGPPTPPPPKPPEDSEFYVGRLISSPLSQQAVLEDRRNAAAPVDKRVEVGQPLYDGHLIYIHPKGAVSEKDGQWRIHPLGEQVKSLQPLAVNDRRFPDVYHEVMKLKEKLEGITQRLEGDHQSGG